MPEQLVYHYQRQRCVRTCAAIKGATSATYRVAAADLGASLGLEVHAVNAKGVTAAVSNRLGPVVTIAQLRTRLAAILWGAKRGRIHTLLAGGGYRFVLVTPSEGRLVISRSTVATRNTRSLVIATLSTMHGPFSRHCDPREIHAEALKRLAPERYLRDEDDLADVSPLGDEAVRVGRLLE